MNIARDQTLPEYRAIFPAIIASVETLDDRQAYGWAELVINPTDGRLRVGDPARFGTPERSPAYALGDARYEVGAEVWMRLRGVRNTEPIYEVLGPTPDAHAFVRLTGSTGLYGGSIQFYEGRVVTRAPNTISWTPSGDPVAVRSPNFESLYGIIDLDNVYLCRYEGLAPDGVTAVYSTSEQVHLSQFRGVDLVPEPVGRIETWADNGLIVRPKPDTPGTMEIIPDSDNLWRVLLQGFTDGHGVGFLPSWASPPATATSPGTAGQIAYDSSYLYVCVATSAWRRVAISSW